MNKKLRLFCSVLLTTLLFKGHAQQTYGTCGSTAPSQQWEAWFSDKVKEYIENNKNTQAKQVTHVIPVIVHVIHNGEALGTFPNIDSNQVYSQLVSLNKDFGAYNSDLSSTPSTFTNLIANPNIIFCKATQNPQGTTLVEPGIERLNTVSKAWTGLATPTLDLQNYLNTVVIPNSIWDPTKYFNIWVSERPPSNSMNGFATYPGGTTLNGLIGGSVGTSTTDGIWVWGKAFGTVGTLNPPYDKGRTTTHETGHWLGLRHIWGDGNCLSDYCNDTPTQKQPYYGCVTSTPLDQCGVNQSPQGEMPFNYMDMSNDLCKFMFTKDQNIRMQTALSQCNNRNLLGTHGLCTGTPVPTSTAGATASFVTNGSACLGSPFTPFNLSSGFPYPTYVWSSSPAASFSPATTVANPAVLINNPGTYTLTLVATNSISSSSYSMVVSANFSCTPGSACIDTIKMIKNIDTLRTFVAPTNSLISGCGPGGFKGYLVGTNCYHDKEIAQFYPPLSFSATPNPQVNSVIVLFDSVGTRAANPGTQIKCKIYGGTVGGGPGGVIGSKSDSLGKIVLTTKVTGVGYCGKPYSTVNHSIIPFKFNMPSPVIINPSSGFFAGIELPITPGDSVNVMSNTLYNTSIDSSSWYFTPNIVWKNYRYGRGYKIQLAILPQITCSPVNGIKENAAALESNVNVVPNPNNGVFSLIFTLKESQDITINVINSLGQKLSSERISNISNRVVDVNLSDEPSGIYFMEVSSGAEKIVKKVVVTH
jgi:hypothetical protein